MYSTSIGRLDAKSSWPLHMVFLLYDPVILCHGNLPQAKILLSR